MTIFEAHQIALRRLRKSFCDTAEAPLFARLLLDEITGSPHAHLTRPDGVLPPGQIARWETLLQEVEEGRPLAYVLGRRNFYNFDFRCDERALIPRPDTEFLIQTALEKLKYKDAENSVFRLADLGTGSGCIAISLARALPKSEIYATDISDSALSLACENAALAGVSERVHFVAGAPGSWAAPVAEYSGAGFDAVLSNPPYIALREIENLQPEIRNFEPRNALDGGEDGLDCYREIAAQCGVLLKPNGAIFCELGAGQFAAVRAIFEAENWRVQNPILDFAGIERVLVANL